MYNINDYIKVQEKYKAAIINLKIVLKKWFDASNS